MQNPTSINLGRVRPIAAAWVLFAGVVELVDTPDLGSGIVKDVQVRVLSPALVRFREAVLPS